MQKKEQCLFCLPVCAWPGTPAGNVYQWDQFLPMFFYLKEQQRINAEFPSKLLQKGFELLWDPLGLDDPFTFFCRLPCFVLLKQIEKANATFSPLLFEIFWFLHLLLEKLTLALWLLSACSALTTSGNLTASHYHPYSVRKPVIISQSASPPLCCAAIYCYFS